MEAEGGDDLGERPGAVDGVGHDAVEGRGEVDALAGCFEGLTVFEGFEQHYAEIVDVVFSCVEAGFAFGGFANAVSA